MRPKKTPGRTSEVGSPSNEATDIRTTGLYKQKARSRITNGRNILPGIDGRTLWVRRFRDLIALHLSDLGDVSAISEAEKAIVRRSACLMVELERLEVVFAENGEATPHQLELYQRTANTLRRLLEALGLQRRPRDVTSLDHYLRTRAQANDDVIDVGFSG